MITVTVTTQELKVKAEEVMQRETLYNPNIGGADFKVVFGDFDTIDGVDEYTGGPLYSEIFTQRFSAAE